MAAFSYNNPALVDSTSFLFPNTPLLLPSYDNNNNDNIINNNGRICGFLGDINNSFPCFSQPFYPAAQGPLQEVSSLNVSSTTKVSSLSNSSSMVTDQNQNNMIPDSSLEPHKKRKSSSKFNSAQSKVILFTDFLVCGGDGFLLAPISLTMMTSCMHKNLDHIVM